MVRQDFNLSGEQEVNVENDNIIMLSQQESKCLSHSISVESMLCEFGLDGQQEKGGLSWYVGQFQQILQLIAAWLDQGIVNIGEILQTKSSVDFVLTRLPSYRSEQQCIQSPYLTPKQKQEQQCPRQLLDSYIPDSFLQQFKHMINPSISKQDIDYFRGQNVLNMQNPSEFFNHPWECIIKESRPGLRYIAYRRPLRNGLYVYKVHQIYSDTTIDELSAFIVNQEFREEWDSHTFQIINLVEADGGSGEEIEGQKDVVVYMRSRYPGPMADREFVAAKRFWRENGCTYHVSKSCDQDESSAVGQKKGRVYKVDDYVSCYVTRPLEGSNDNEVEFVGIYFEDPGISSGIVNLIIKKGLWGSVQKHERALRLYQQCKREQQVDDSQTNHHKVLNSHSHKNHRIKNTKDRTQTDRQGCKVQFVRQGGSYALKLEHNSSRQKRSKWSQIGTVTVLGLKVLQEVMRK
eukprot:TRINITY_DN2527_c0_g5_i1.p1 TRINITY_DN2527_c0_g5~~TRINITY_DN2527_c0_g5_i1.p1  ORF type:complete len:462 (-),score=25.10 TRINITY_DN2527_c0_g5_i1:4367-5752(-)